MFVHLYGGTNYLLSKMLFLHTPHTPLADRFVVFGSAALTKTTKHSIRLSSLLRASLPAPPDSVGRQAGVTCSVVKASPRMGNTEIDYDYD